jgi:hypothetical protein
MAVPIFIALIAGAAGVLLAARWLPRLGHHQAADIAFWATCGLIAVAFALVAVHVYEIVRELDTATVGGVGNAEPDVVASGIADTLRDIGPVLGLAAAAYLLGSAARRET